MNQRLKRKKSLLIYSEFLIANSSLYWEDIMKICYWNDFISFKFSLILVLSVRCILFHWGWADIGWKCKLYCVCLVPGWNRPGTLGPGPASSTGESGQSLSLLLLPDYCLISVACFFSQTVSVWACFVFRYYAQMHNNYMSDTTAPNNSSTISILSTWFWFHSVIMRNSECHLITTSVTHFITKWLLVAL